MSVKIYNTRKSARFAIKRAGLHGMNVRYDTFLFGRTQMVKPVVICELREDYLEVLARGFDAEMANELADA